MQSRLPNLRSLFLILPAILCCTATGVSGSAPKREVRAAWVATVTNLDWPSNRTASPTTQKAELRSIFDQLQQAGINTIIFQVRTECDALYASPVEPWSYWLTGTEGKAPSPLYDPLEFAVQEAHARGMELHAWLNPYRAVRDTNSFARASTHVSVQHPSWIITIGSFRFLDPGLPEVRSYVSSIVADIVRRYDIDGIHFDDYFYPYPPNGITTQDNATFVQYPRGIADRGNWRRDNVNLLIRAVHDSIQAFKPHVRFGISPFGIWRSGYPSSALATTTSYGDLYADVLAWVREETIDYVTPQLYWAIGSQTSASYPHNTDYAVLMPWWSDSVAAHGRHFYPGHAAYRISPSSSNWAASEVLSQIRLNRQNPKAQGSVFFRAQVGINDNMKGFRDSLITDLYRSVALPPVMAWKDAVPPYPPRGMRFAPLPGSAAPALQWDTPIAAADGDTANRYVVYMFTHPPTGTDLADAANIRAVVNTRSYMPTVQVGNDAAYYCVTALDRNNNESDTSTVVRIIALPAPSLVAPPNLAVSQPVALDLRWSPVASATTYQVHVSLVTDFSTLVRDTAGIADTSLALSGLASNTIYNWRVRAASDLGTGAWSGMFRFRTAIQTGVEAAEVPATVSLSQNFPNPFNPATSIRFTIPADVRVRLTVYDLLGREVAALVDADLPAGSYTIPWDAREVASGMYVYRLQAGDVVQARRMLLLR